KVFLDIVGDGSKRKEISEFLVSHNINHKFYGWIRDHAAILNIIRDSVFVLSASYLTILDAFSQGRIPISFYQNELKGNYLLGLRRAVGRSPITCNSPENFTKKILELLNNEMIQQKAIHDSTTYISTHTWHDLARLYIRLLKGD
ncbi:MAG: hypothetical protein Q6373_005820, partial [Candidatus Sigynarchaeota archaeon]